MDLFRIKKTMQIIAECKFYDRWQYFTDKDEPCSFETLICDYMNQCRWPDNRDVKLEGNCYYSYVDKDRDEITELVECHVAAQDWLGLTTKQYLPFWEQCEPPNALVEEYGNMAEKVEDIRNLVKLYNSQSEEKINTIETNESLEFYVGHKYLTKIELFNFLTGDYHA